VENSGRGLTEGRGYKRHGLGVGFVESFVSHPDEKEME
jgi:hypothetical protein